MQKKLKMILAACTLALASAASAQTTAFTYQGKLVDDCCPATGLYDLTFKLFDNGGSGNSGQQGPTVSKVAVPITNGLFSVSLDFGAALFNGTSLWLQMEVRTNSATPPATFITLSPRTELSPTPSAIYAQKAGTVADNAITASKIAAGAAVKRLNGLSDLVNLVAGANITLTTSGNNLQISAAGAGGSGIWSLNGTTTYYNAGNVGIGTSSPGAKLHVDGGNSGRGIYAYDVTGEAIVGDSWTGSAVVGYSGGGGVGLYGVSLSNKGVFGLGDYGVWGQSDNNGGRGVLGSVTGGGDAVGVYGQNTASGRYGQLGTASYGVNAYGGTGWALHAEGDNGSPLPGLRPRAYLAGGSSVGNRAARFEGVVELKGSLGIGTTAPGAPLHIEASQAYERLLSTNTANGSVLEMWNSTVQLIDGPPVTLGAINFGNGTATPGQVSYDVNQTSHRMAFRVGGTEQVVFSGSGNVSVGSLTIRGGADLAEPFLISGDKIPEGSVVIIDEDKSGHLKQASQAYDPRVAGIVSGANGVNAGISLHQEGVLEGSQNVALTGRVYVKADAAYGSIKPGDLLTTSDTPGHAMKVTDSARAQGAILGKAMSALKDGKGMVLVLVSLQ